MTSLTGMGPSEVVFSSKSFFWLSSVSASSTVIQLSFPQSTKKQCCASDWARMGENCSKTTTIRWSIPSKTLQFNFDTLSVDFRALVRVGCRLMMIFKLIDVSHIWSDCQHLFRQAQLDGDLESNTWILSVPACVIRGCNPNSILGEESKGSLEK